MCTNFRSLALRVWDLWFIEDLEEKDLSLNQLINSIIIDGGVCKTAQDTTGLLNMKVIRELILFRFVLIFFVLLCNYKYESCKVNHKP